MSGCLIPTPLTEGPETRIAQREQRKPRRAAAVGTVVALQPGHEQRTRRRSW